MAVLTYFECDQFSNTFCNVNVVKFREQIVQFSTM